MDNMNHEYNFKHGLTEGEISEAVKDYKAKHKAAFEAKMFAQLSAGQKVFDETALNGFEGYDLDLKLKQKIHKDSATVHYDEKRSAAIPIKILQEKQQPEPTGKCAHDWRTHTTVNDTVPTGENHALTGAEINRLENRVTKVYCSRCLEVRGI